ncbi:MAG: hypothetical protein WDZ40_02650 [Candidatus Spechtbacterales bacterium]
MSRKKRVPIWGVRGNNVSFSTQIECSTEKFTLEELKYFVELAFNFGISPLTRIEFSDFNGKSGYYYNTHGLYFYVDSQTPLGESVYGTKRVFCSLYMLDLGTLNDFIETAVNTACEREARVYILGGDNRYCIQPDIDNIERIRVEVPLE